MIPPRGGILKRLKVEIVRAKPWTENKWKFDEASHIADKIQTRKKASTLPEIENQALHKT